uniref:Transcription factor grauzone n=1 Tax=Glossina palpalis gambiensis TaxID=67801 RepID=A0A1B0APQ5_9MUSC
MSICQLCAGSCEECRNLYDEHGQGTEVYDITVKYFDPMLLSSNIEQDSRVICGECWRHISEFYDFQRSVLTIQNKLETESKHLIPLIKLEDEILLDQELLPKNECELSLNDVLDGEFLNIRGDDILNDIEKTQPTNSDDEKPLITRARRKSKIKSESIKKCNAKKKICKKTPSKARQQRTEAVRKSKRTIGTIGTINKNYYNKQDNNEKSFLNTENVTNPNDNIEMAKKSKMDMDLSFQTSNEMPNTIENTSSNYDSEDNRAASTDGQQTHFNRSQDYDAFISEWKQDLSCVVCNAEFATLALLRSHFRQEHPNHKCYVLCCQRKFFHRYQLVEHIRVHIKPDIFKCEVCGKCAPHSRGLRKHIRERHTKEGQERQYECNVCQKRFTKKPILKAHMEIHVTGSKDHICKECGKGFVLETRLKAHERSVHNIACVCDQCGKTVRGKYALKRHLLEHAGVTKRKWTCDQCEAQLNSHYALKRHKEAIHHDGTTVYVCKDCGKIAPSAQALRCHKKYVHQAERKYKCSICDKAFKVAIVLKEHMAAHTGEDLYQCPYCPKTFKVSSNMHHHRKKSHPIEWAEARQNKQQTNKVDVNLVSNEVIL